MLTLTCICIAIDYKNLHSSKQFWNHKKNNRCSRLLSKSWLFICMSNFAIQTRRNDERIYIIELRRVKYMYSN